MVGIIIAFIVGLMLGATFGMVTAAFMAASSRRDGDK